MTSVEVTISGPIAARYPLVIVGGFLVEGLDRAAAALGDGRALMEAARAELLARGLTLEGLAGDPRVAGWREAIADFGKPSKFKGSAEQCARRILKDGAISTPLPVVAAYCGIAAKHVAPLGCYDLDRLPGPHIELRMGRPETDSFQPIGARPEDMPIGPKVVVYACGDEVLCWGFNCRDSARVCLLPETSAAAFFGEAVRPAHEGPMRAALEELARLLRDRGAGVGEVAYASKSSPRAALEL